MYRIKSHVDRHLGSVEQQEEDYIGPAEGRFRRLEKEDTADGGPHGRVGDEDIPVGREP